MIARRNARTPTRSTAALALALAASIGLGCASAKVTTISKIADETTLPQPGAVLVYDFAVTADDVVEDTFGAEFHTEATVARERYRADQILDGSDDKSKSSKESKKDRKKAAAESGSSDDDGAASESGGFFSKLWRRITGRA